MQKNSDMEQNQEILKIEVLQDILNLHMNLHEASYTSANFLIGMTGVLLSIIIVGAIPNLEKFTGLAKLGLAVIALASLIALIICLKVIDPIIDNKTEKKNLNLFYYKSFLSHSENYIDYKENLSVLIKNEDSIIEQYAMEIYHLSKFVLKPKFKELKCATWILIIGISIGIFLICVSVIHLEIIENFGSRA